MWLQEEGVGKFNSVEAVLKRHTGEVKSMTIPYWVPWEEGDYYPPETEWRWFEGRRFEGWHFKTERETCFSLAEVCAAVAQHT